VVQNPHANLDQHQKLTTLAHAYQVWSTTITVIVSYPAQRQNERMTYIQNEQKHNSASLGRVIIFKYITQHKNCKDCDVKSKNMQKCY